MASYEGVNVLRGAGTTHDGDFQDQDMDSFDEDYAVVDTPSCTTSGPISKQNATEEVKLLDDVKALSDEDIKPFYAEPTVLVKVGRSFETKSWPLGDYHTDIILVPFQAVKDALGSSNADITPEMEPFVQSYTRRSEWLGQEVEVADLFDAAGEKKGHSCRILVTGSVGMGKTVTFLKMAAMKWARGDLWPEFTIVSAWPLQYVQTATNITQLLQLEELTISDPDDQKMIARFVKKYPYKVCFIFDCGLESSLDHCSRYVRRVICGELLKGCNIILTCRHSRQVLELSAAYPFDKHLEAMGFTQQRVRDHISKTLPSPAMRAALLDKMEMHAHLAALMLMPFFSAAICDIVRCHGIVPETVGDVFFKHLLLVIRQNTEQPYASWSDVPRLPQEQILELGRFFFVMLLENKIMFSEKDFRKHHVLPEARSAGFLLPAESTSASAVCQWQLSHLAIRDFISSIYVASTCRKPVDITWLVGIVAPALSHMTGFWPLLLPQLPPAIKEALLEGQLAVSSRQSCPVFQPSFEMFGHKQLLFYAETDLHNMSEVLCSILSQDGIEKLVDSVLRGLVPDVLMEVQSLIKNRRDAHNQDFLKAALHLWRRMVPRADISMLHRELEAIDSEDAAKFASFLSTGNISLDIEPSTPQCSE